MKEYRKPVADAFALQQVLMYLSERADDLQSIAEDHRKRDMNDESDKRYYLETAFECEVKAAAFERLLEKLAK